jgi:uncharacterized protein YegP (UPF0339 family)
MDIMQIMGKAGQAEGSIWGKFGMYAFFIFFTIAVISLVAARMTQKPKKEYVDKKGVERVAAALPQTEEEPVNEVKLNDLVNTRFSIEIGSGKTTGNWSSEELIEKLKEAIKHNLFDREFYYNWTDLGKEYNSIFEKETLSPMIKNIDRTLKEFFVLKGSTLVFRLEGSNAQKWIDKWFQTKKSISNELKSDYYAYRKKYAGVTLRESVNEEAAGTLKIEKHKDGKYYWQFKFKSGKTEDWPNAFNTKADAQKDFIYRSKYLKEGVNGCNPCNSK